MQTMKLFLCFQIIFMTTISADMLQIKESIKDICNKPSKNISKYYKIVATSDANFRVKFLGRLGGEANFTQEEWEGVERIAQKDVLKDRISYRKCVKNLTPLFLGKFSTHINNSKVIQKDNSFYFIDKKMDWYNARKECKNKNMILPTIKLFKTISKDEFRPNQRYWTSDDGYSNEKYTYSYGWESSIDILSVLKNKNAYVLCIAK